MEDINVTLVNNATNRPQINQLGYFFSLAVNFVMILVGNVSLLIFICTRSKSRMLIFILNLAVADLCVGVFVVMPQFIERILMQFHGPENVCKIKWFLQTMIAYCASYALVVLSIDRVDAIANPMKTSTTKSSLQSGILIAGNWILSAIFAIPMLFWTSIRNHPQYGRQCTLWLGKSSNNTNTTVNMWKVYFTVNIGTVIVIPIVIVALCHLGLILVIMKASRGPMVVETPSNSMDTNKTIKRDSHVGGRQCISKAKVKTVQITFTIVSVFIICWSPFTIGNLLELYDVLQMGIDVRIFIQTLGTLNSAVNPIIFFLFNHKLCKKAATRTGNGTNNIQFRKSFESKRNAVNSIKQRRSDNSIHLKPLNERNGSTQKSKSNKTESAELLHNNNSCQLTDCSQDDSDTFIQDCLEHNLYSNHNSNEQQSSSGYTLPMENNSSGSCCESVIQHGSPTHHQQQPIS